MFSTCTSVSSVSNVSEHSNEVADTSSVMPLPQNASGSVLFGGFELALMEPLEGAGEDCRRLTAGEFCQWLNIRGCGITPLSMIQIFPVDSGDLPPVYKTMEKKLTDFACVPQQQVMQSYHEWIPNESTASLIGDQCQLGAHQVASLQLDLSWIGQNYWQHWIEKYMLYVDMNDDALQRCFLGAAAEIIKSVKTEQEVGEKLLFGVVGSVSLGEMVLTKLDTSESFLKKDFVKAEHMHVFMAIHTGHNKWRIIEQLLVKEDSHSIYRQLQACFYDSAYADGLNLKVLGDVQVDPLLNLEIKCFHSTGEFT